MAATSFTPSAEVVQTYGPEGRSAWLDIDWREHQRWVTVAGRPVNVIDLGAGERTIVFIHGLSGSWQNWLENLPHFAEPHRCIAMDLPGFGYSPDAGAGDHDHRLRADRRRAPDRARRSSAAVVVGNSMGGFIGAEVAIQFSTRVDKLVLVSAAGLSIENIRNDRIFAAPAARRRAVPLLGRVPGVAVGRR